MSFNILYVEDCSNDFDDVQAAVLDHNRDNSSERLHIEWAKSPEELGDKLGLKFDLVLADVFFDEGDGNSRDRLQDIIDNVTTWGNECNGGRPLPIIAYTRRGSLPSCLSKKSSLYDIWDKNTATPPYVAWRLSKIASDVSRAQPDAFLQRQIRKMNPKVHWHKHVVNMAQRYHAGWTEADQIDRATHSIEKLAQELGVFMECQPLWQVMVDWESLGRAVYPGVRGHARHVINVFWFGYFILNHPDLDENIEKFWKSIINHGKMASVSDVSPHEAMSTIWFFAGVFHDIGAPVEKGFGVIKNQMGKINGFAPSGLELLPLPPDLLPLVEEKQEVEEQIRTLAKVNQAKALSVSEELIDLFDKPIKQIISNSFSLSIKKKSPDHGVVGALQILNKVKGLKQKCYAREAARAIALHNIICDTDALDSISWEEEPIICLLLLCDQIQTWDRERDDSKHSDKDKVERAELSSIEIKKSDAGIEIVIGVDYIAPAYFSNNPDIFERVREELEKTLREKPYRALQKIRKPWPFKVRCKFKFGGQILQPDMTFE